jgi:hypothetical protein
MRILENAAPIEIHWVNHASFVYARGGVRLLCDPWLSGTAFNNGWRHITPTRFEPRDFRDITHVWISHQHPDHFAPQDLRRVAREDRERLTVLYQTVPDKLVVSWLRSAGFKDVRELPMEQWTSIGPGVEVLCGALADDSWLAVRSPGLTVLNVNDCVLKHRNDVAAIKALVGDVDVLLTQFSYAQWIGNAEETERRRADAREKFQRIRLQCEVLDPQIVIPFASYIYFSNRENFFMNDAVNRIGDICTFIETDLGRKAVVLYPGESWRVPETADWRPAALRYEADFASCLSAGPLDTPRMSDPLGFVQHVNDFLNRLRKKNPIAALTLRESATLYLTDHCSAYRLSARGLKPIALARTDSDLATSSENVLYAFRTPWGANTLHVSGRFESFRPDGHLRFFRLMGKLHYYNRTPVNAAWVRKQLARIVRGAFRRLGRATRSIVSRSARGPAQAPATDSAQFSESTRPAQTSAEPPAPAALR